MAELVLMPKPDKDVKDVTTSYQRQNALLYLLQTGLERIKIEETGNNIILYNGGAIEINGVIYKITSDITLTKPIPERAYWISFNSSANGNTIVPNLTTKPGIWNSDKQGFYENNNRVLNWVSSGIVSDFGAPIYFSNLKGNHSVTLQPGWYQVEVSSGLGQGDAINAWPLSWPNSNETTPNNATPGQGGEPVLRVSQSRLFYNDTIRTFNLFVGGNGFKGQNGFIGQSGTNTLYNITTVPFFFAGAGGAGGSGVGQESIFYFNQNDSLSSGRTLKGLGSRGSMAISARGPNVLNTGINQIEIWNPQTDSDSAGTHTTPAKAGMNQEQYGNMTWHRPLGGSGGGLNGGGGGPAAIRFVNASSGVGNSNVINYQDLIPGNGGIAGADGDFQENGTLGGIVQIFKLD